MSVAAVLLCGCARDPLVSSTHTTSAGNWKIENQVDRITGAPLASAYLMTRNSSNSGVPLAHPAMLQVLCFKDQPAIRISFEFKVGSEKNAVFGYRFDEKPGHESDARFVQDYKTVVIEDKAEVDRFIGEMATSSALYVRIRSLNVGRSSAEFQLDGAPAAIGAALAGCHAAPPAKQAGAQSAG
jgi:hypothetical protein